MNIPQRIARFFRRGNPDRLVQRLEAYTRLDTNINTPLRPIVGPTGEFVGWMKDAA